MINFLGIYFLGILGIRRKHGRAIAASAAVGLATAVIWWQVGSKINNVPTPYIPSSKLDMLASRDMGTILPVGTGSNQWCGTTDTLAAPIHCWDLQESSGTFADDGSTGGWTMALNGATRQNIISSVPIPSGATFDITSEVAMGADSIGGIGSSSTQTLPSGNAFSYTLIGSWSPTHPTFAHQYAVHHFDTYGIDNYITIATKISAVYAKGPTTGKYLMSLASDIFDGAIHCYTIVPNGTGVNLGRIFLDGVDITNYASADLSGTGDWTNTATAYFWRRAAGTYMAGGLGVRARMDATAISLAEHRELCGTLYDAPDEGETHILANDNVWTDVVGARCFDVGSHRAFCATGIGAAMAYDATKMAVGWPVEPARTNRIPWSVGVNCTRWGCSGSGSATLGSVAPDGTATASFVSAASGANVVTTAASGYTNNADLYLNFWLKCDGSGTVDISNDATALLGNWDIDCSCLGTDWERVDQWNSCVTVNSSFTADATGWAHVRFDGNIGAFSGDIWGVTLTETKGLSVIPTFGAAVAVSASNWYIDNTGGEYYVAGDSIDTTVTEISGTCWNIDGTKLRLSGATGSECLGIWHCLNIGGACP